jgi:hypothetical protein
MCSTLTAKRQGFLRCWRVLYGLEPRDPVTLAGASLVLVVVAAPGGTMRRDDQHIDILHILGEYA